MKNFWHSYKIIIFIVLAFLIAIPLVFGGEFRDFYPSYHGQTTYINDISVLGVMKTCVFNNSTYDYFIPTKTRAEWDAFAANHPAGTTVQGCCGDGYCNFYGDNTGSKEAVVNTGTYSSYTVCTADCGTNTACGNGVCDSAYDTHANCPSECCAAASDCGSNGCQVSPTCGSNTQVCSMYWVFSCSSGNCSHTQSSKSSTCGGRENSMCDGGYCTNKCSGYFPGDQDGDGYTDAQDPDCGGCGSLCTGGSGSGCNSTNNCYANGGSCGLGGTWLNGFCIGQSQGTCYPSCVGGQSCYAGNCISNSGNYCPPGYSGSGMMCSPCAAGTYSNGGTLSCSSCPTGYKCPGGMPAIPCPSGQTSSNGVCYNMTGYNGDYSN